MTVSIRTMVVTWFMLAVVTEQPAITEQDRLDQALIFVGLKTAVAPELLAAHLGVPVDGPTVSRLLEEGLLRSNARELLLLTTEGRAARDAWYAATREGDAAGPLRDVYVRFLPVNARFLDWTNRWQVRSDRGDVPNDHTDPHYDGRLLRQLGSIHKDTQALLSVTSSLLPRFQFYRRVLDQALLRVSSGALEYVADPRRLSYHQTWFEMHEDWLHTLGLQRDT